MPTAATVTRTETRIERARAAVLAAIRLHPEASATPVAWVRGSDPGAALVRALADMGVHGQAVANATGALGEGLALNPSTASRILNHPRDVQPRTLYLLCVVYLLALECHDTHAGVEPDEQVESTSADSTSLPERAMTLALHGMEQGRFAPLRDLLVG